MAGLLFFYSIPDGSHFNNAITTSVGAFFRFVDIYR